MQLVCFYFFFSAAYSFTYLAANTVLLSIVDILVFVLSFLVLITLEKKTSNNTQNQSN